MAQALDQHDIDQARGGCDVMRHGPCLHCESSHENGAGDQWETHFAVLKSPRKRQQQNCEQSAKIKLPNGNQLVGSSAEGAAEGSVLLELSKFPAIEVTDNHVVIFGFGPR